LSYKFITNIQKWPDSVHIYTLRSYCTEKPSGGGGGGGMIYSLQRIDKAESPAADVYI
jgi:hypothetical protein